MSVKKILVTGGAGFIGSHVTKILCDLNYSVVVVDDLSFGYKKFVDKRARFINGSIAKRSLIEKALEGVDVVVHLAASSVIKFSYTKPVEYYENNILNGIVLLEAMRKKYVKKIIFSSSASVYGVNDSIPIREDAQKNPITLYGSSKLAFEEILYAYYISFGINSVSLRYFNAYGPRDEQKPITRAVPKWIKAVLKNENITLYWKGEQLRDYVYVTDIAKVHIAVLNSCGYQIYNIGSGHGVWMSDIVRLLKEISGKKLNVVDAGERRGDPPRLVADIKKIKGEIGWKPTVSLKEGLKKTYEYYESVYKTNLPKE